MFLTCLPLKGFAFGSTLSLLIQQLVLMMVASCKRTTRVKNDLVFCLYYCPLDNKKPFRGILKTTALRKACITAARLTYSGHEHVSCEHAASPSKSSALGSTSTCKTFAADSALSGVA